MEPVLKVVLIGLAAWRSSALLSYERGPFSLFLHLRELLGFEHTSGGEPVAWPSGFLGGLLSCLWCLGIYAVLLMWGLWALEPALVYIMAAWALVVATEKLIHG